jgi:hypothetical protein
MPDLRLRGGEISPSGRRACAGRRGGRNIAAEASTTIDRYAPGSTGDQAFGDIQPVLELLAVAVPMPPAPPRNFERCCCSCSIRSRRRHHPRPLSWC